MIYIFKRRGCNLFNFAEKHKNACKNYANVGTEAISANKTGDFNFV